MVVAQGGGHPGSMRGADFLIQVQGLVQRYGGLGWPGHGKVRTADAFPGARLLL